MRSIVSSLHKAGQASWIAPMAVVELAVHIYSGLQLGACIVENSCCVSNGLHIGARYH